jgi:hypothetical protein
MQTMIGLMLMKQPFFMGGIDDVEVAKGSAFGAAGTFFFTFIVSILYMMHDAQRLADARDDSNGSGSRSGGRQGDYGQVPTVFRDQVPTGFRDREPTGFRDFDDDVPQTLDETGLFV